MSNLLGLRDANGIPVPMTVDESIASMKASLLKASSVQRMFTAWTAAAATVAKSEIFATLSPLFDCRTFWYQSRPVPAPCGYSANFTGGNSVPCALRRCVPRQSAPDPKICISYGACGNSGGIFHDLYCVWGGTDKIKTGGRVYSAARTNACGNALYGFAMALGLLEQKFARAPGELDEQPAGNSASGYMVPAAASEGGSRGLAVWRDTAMVARLLMTI